MTSPTETTSTTTAPAGDATAEGKAEETPTTFTQADLDRIVKERVQRERAKFADYDDLKKKAGESATAEDRIKQLENEVQASKREALKRRVQAAHGISDEDADLFLTASDEDTLTAQAKRLADRESERKKQGNVVAREGNITRPAASDERTMVRELFGTGG